MALSQSRGKPSETVATASLNARAEVNGMSPAVAKAEIRGGCPAAEKCTAH